jgi:DNA-binding CsgD family transcriptional regulator
MTMGRTRNDVPLAAALPEREGAVRPCFAIDGHYFIAIPQKEWSVAQRRSGLREKVRAAGFVELHGKRHVLIEQAESRGATERASPISSILTSRELQIAYAVADGKCDKVIAHDLGISEYTVREHMRRIFHKLKVSKRAAVVAAIGQRPLGLFFPGILCTRFTCGFPIELRRHLKCSGRRFCNRTSRSRLTAAPEIGSCPRALNFPTRYHAGELHRSRSQRR